MNDEEEEAMVVMQESHLPLVEEREPPEPKPEIEHGEEFEAFEAAEAALSEVEKTNERNERRDVGDSLSFGESRGEVIVGAEAPVVKDASFVMDEVEGEDTASLVTQPEKEDELIGRIEDSVANAIERGESSMAAVDDAKIDDGGESQATLKQDDESNMSEEIAKVKESEEVDGSELYGEGSFAVPLQDCEMMKEGNTEAPGTGGKVVEESEFELNEDTDKREVEEEEIKMDERRGKAVEEKEKVHEKVDHVEEGHEVLPVTAAVKGDLLIEGVEDMILIQKDVGGDENLDGDRDTCAYQNNHDESTDAIGNTSVDEKKVEGREIEEVDCSQLNSDGFPTLTLQDNEMVEGGVAMTLGAETNVVKDSELELKDEAKKVGVEEEKEFKMEEIQEEAKEEVNEAFGETAIEENQVDAVNELGEEAEAPKAKELCPYGGEEKLDGDCEAQMDLKQDDEPNVGGEIAKLDEKICGDRDIAEVDGFQQNADGLFPVTSPDDDMVEDDKTKALGTEPKENDIKVGEIDIKDESGDMEVDEERQREENEEDKEIESGLEKEDKAEHGEDEKEATPKSGSGKQKRGRNSKFAGKAPPRKTVGEDVCFICLDGGDLVLCDRRSCPKAYHPSCVDHDEAFFRSKGRWDCGWHLCRQCKKNAYYMCYMCQFSLCKGCLTDQSKFFCVRGSKGLCHTCMKTVMLIENNEGNADMAAFDDTSSMDYLFKDYWIEQKEKLSITSDEIVMLVNRWQRSNDDPDLEMLAEAHADGSTGKAEATNAKKRGKRRLKSQSEGADPNIDNLSKDDLGNVPKRKKAKKLSRAHAFEVDSTNEFTSQNSTEWASKELLAFVAHVKNGDRSPLSPFDVQELILEYVKSNKLRDPRRTSQIVCDAMLQRLFGKPRVGHIEMLKLLESHFRSKDDFHGDDHEGSVLDAENSQYGTDENTDSFMDAGKTKGRKARKRSDGRGLQSNLDDYAAVDMHNIKLIYLRRKLIEALLEDKERFYEKVVGSFVRIRIAGSSQKEIHRLVQVIGAPEAAVPYKVGKRTAYCMLEILNLNKTEVISIDAISNQDFDEDECKRLRQSIKCGFLSRLTVGDVLDKARDLQVVRVNDWLETEITRLNHLRDRASDLGLKKQLRECVEKLQLLNTPEERQRRLDEIPEVHADPNMDPSHESEDESESDKGQEPDIWRRETWREREHFPSRRGGDSPSTNPRSSATRSPSRKWEPSRSLSGKGFSSSRPGDTVLAEEPLSGKPWSPVGDKTPYQSTSLGNLRAPSDMLTGNQGQVLEMRTSRSPAETSRPPSAAVLQSEVKTSETEKLWHYKDPTGKVQGPFSVVQLRKWNKNGYFPATLRIWSSCQSENDSILLSEALAGRFHKEPQTQAVAKPVETTPSQQVQRGPVVVSRLQVDQTRGIDQMSPTLHRSQSLFSNNDSQSRTPTSSQSISPGSTGRTRVSRWSGSPTPPAQLPSPTPDRRSQLSRSSSMYERKGSFDQSDPSQQPTREAVSLPRNTGRDDHERLGSVYPVLNPPSHHTQQAVIPETTTASTSTSIAQNSAVGQNPNGWGSSGQSAVNPNIFNTNAGHTQNTITMHTQGQQQPLQQQPQQLQQPVYSHWQNALTSNHPPPPPTYNSTAAQTMSSNTFPTQAHLSAMPSQTVPWTMPQLPTAQPATTQLPANAAGWAQQMQQLQQQQAYMNMGWGVAPTGPSPAVAQQYGSQQPGGTLAGQPAMMQPGSANPSGWVAPPAANPGVAGPWNWQPRQPQGQSMVAPAGTWIPKGQKPCPYLKLGHCKKGAGCDFRHNL